MFDDLSVEERCENMTVVLVSSDVVSHHSNSMHCHGNTLYFHIGYKLTFPHFFQSLASGLHHLMQYMCAYVQLGGILEKSGDIAHDKKEFGAFWGGVESIGKKK